MAKIRAVQDTYYQRPTSPHELKSRKSVWHGGTPAAAVFLFTLILDDPLHCREAFEGVWQISTSRKVLRESDALCVRAAHRPVLPL